MGHVLGVRHGRGQRSDGVGLARACLSEGNHRALVACHGLSHQLQCWGTRCYLDSRAYQVIDALSTAVAARFARHAVQADCPILVGASAPVRFCTNPIPRVCPSGLLASNRSAAPRGSALVGHPLHAIKVKGGGDGPYVVRSGKHLLLASWSMMTAIQVPCQAVSAMSVRLISRGNVPKGHHPESIPPKLPF